MNVEIAILAGGRSRRMGRNKAALLLRGERMVERIRRNASQAAPAIIIEDDIGPAQGPLSGIVTAFKRSSAQGILFLSCDMPLLRPGTIRQALAQARGKAAFARTAEGFSFPFFLPRRALPTVLKQLEKGRHSLQELAQTLEARALTLAGTARSECLNVNTPEDFARAEKILQKLEGDRVIEIDRMTIRRGKVTILHELSWQVRKGEHWVILGANGSGKTSLLSAITGYLTPSAGHISVLGQVYGESDWRELRKRVGIVSSAVRQMMGDSEPALHTVASGKEAVIDYWGKPKRQDAAAAMAVLDQVECAYLADRPWAVLSQGERQRVLIGRALMANPALLILDEPCAGLDPAAREHFLQFLERLGRKKDAPSLALVTHHVEEIVGPFTNILLLKGGRALASGSRDKMLTNKLLSETFASPVRLFRRRQRYFLEVRPRPAKVI